MVLTLYVNKFESNLENVEKIIKRINNSFIDYKKFNQIKISRIRTDSIGNNEKYFEGEILFKTEKNSFKYDVNENDLSVIIDEEIVYISNKIKFIIYFNKKIIVFENKKIGKQLKEYLSLVLFHDEKELKEIKFDPTKILNDYRINSKFADIWYNGGNPGSKINAINQYGYDITTDPNFQENFERYGIGVELKEKEFNHKKVAVYKNGTIVALLPKIKEELIPFTKLKIYSLFEKYII